MGQWKFLQTLPAGICKLTQVPDDDDDDDDDDHVTSSMMVMTMTAMIMVLVMIMIVAGGDHEGSVDGAISVRAMPTMPTITMVVSRGT